MLAEHGLRPERVGLPRILGSAIGLALVLASASTPAGLLSKRYEFKHGVELSVGVSAPDGLRLDGVWFKMPVAHQDRLTRTGGLPSARVSVSNTAQRALKVGLAIALFDDEDRLLAVASGGSGLATIKPGRQKSYRLVFEGVQAEAHKATTFMISLESKP